MLSSVSGWQVFSFKVLPLFDLVDVALYVKTISRNLQDVEN